MVLPFIGRMVMTFSAGWVSTNIINTEEKVRAPNGKPEIKTFKWVLIRQNDDTTAAFS